MPPQVLDESTPVGRETAKALNLQAISKSLPPEVFVKSLPRSLFHMAFDYTMWFGSAYAMSTLCNSPVWAELPFWAQALATLVFWNIAGFFMWCIFVVGHDCGHGTFSTSETLNDILGHINHASILVPFYPWQVNLDLSLSVGCVSKIVWLQRSNR
jgi:acyl-lipid omega-3 desaturase